MRNLSVGKLVSFIQKETETEMVTLDIDINDDAFLIVAKMAHNRDITFNQMITIILEEQILENKE